jgi:eukaryotic-like serine/threonine-protein kinase
MNSIPREEENGSTRTCRFYNVRVALSVGTRLGPFEIVAPLGAGGMGEVYRARDTRLGREVALKILPERVANDPTALARFEREAQVLASLSHPNIVNASRYRKA